MHTVASRAGRWPLALTLLGLIALGACADDPVAPKIPSKPNLSASASDDFVELTVTNASGGLEIGSLRSEVNQIRSGGGAIHFDPSLDGATITLDAPLNSDGPLYIVGPAKGITLSGNDQHRIIDGTAPISAKNVTFTKGYGDYASAIRASSVYLDNSTVRDNRGPGSAIRAQYVLSLINSTVSRNVVGAAAVEYRESAQVFIDNSTIAYNAPAAGLGPSGYPGAYMQVTLRNSILANNGSPLQNCATYAGFVYQGTNVVNDWSCADVAITPSDPQLMPLARNGGPNMTHAIPHTSPAYNTGVNCSQTTDQRYVARDAKCDVGAFEFNDLTKVTITIDPTVRLDTGLGYGLLTGTMKCTRDETIPLALELHQDQKVGKVVVDVHSAATTQVACSPTTTTWARKMFLSQGAWQAGAARATATTYNTAEWVAPAAVSGAVKLSIIRK